MRKCSIIIICLWGLGVIHQTFPQQIAKGRSKAARSLFTRTTQSTTPVFSPTRTGKSYSSHAPVCPKPKKKMSSLHYKSFGTSSTAEKFTPEGQPRPAHESTNGSKVLEYARRNPGKVIGVVSGIGAATATHGWSKKYKKKLAIEDEIQQLSYGVGFYSSNNIHNKQYVDDLLKGFVQKGIVNEKNRSGQTPVMIILGSNYIYDNEKAPMLKFLFNNGAVIEGKDKKIALNFALGLNENTYSVHSKGLKFKPYLRTLKLILPYMDKKDIEDLAEAFDRQVTPPSRTTRSCTKKSR